jgi:bis(5'-nucleosyl)-tetraphosphatase (symmetrical)
MIYLIGDLQGCCDAFDRLLAQIGFSASRDELIVLGDLVNRGPASLGVLERLASFGTSARCVLGNHDLHLLAVACGIRPPGRSDTLAPILASPKLSHWIDWIRHQPLALHDHGWLMVHAGVLPQWEVSDVLRLAAEVESGLRGSELTGFLSTMYGNEPSVWDEGLQGPERMRLIVNALTRVRFVSPQGRMDFDSTESATQAPPGLVPWFDAEQRRTAGVPVAFGHWSTLGALDRPDLMALDSGCVWGGQLTAARIDGGRRERLSVGCEQAQVPGQRTV